MLHGDINPKNIFFDENLNIMTSDLGSLQYLREPDINQIGPLYFYETLYTINFASPEHINPARNKIP